MKFSRNMDALAMYTTVLPWRKIKSFWWKNGIPRNIKGTEIWPHGNDEGGCHNRGRWIHLPGDGNQKIGKNQAETAATHKRSGEQHSAAIQAIDGQIADRQQDKRQTSSPLLAQVQQSGKHKTKQTPAQHEYSGSRT